MPCFYFNLLLCYSIFFSFIYYTDIGTSTNVKYSLFSIASCHYYIEDVPGCINYAALLFINLMMNCNNTVVVTYSNSNVAVFDNINDELSVQNIIYIVYICNRRALLHRKFYKRVLRWKKITKPI